LKTARDNLTSAMSGIYAVCTCREQIPDAAHDDVGEFLMIAEGLAV
jgi:hypothetical protein